MASKPEPVSPTPPAQEAQSFTLLHPRDNILICIRSAAAGDPVVIDGERYILGIDIALGHKIARTALQVGDKVLRYGIPIGSMTAAATPGAHIHSHNLKSDYIPAHNRDAARVEEIRS